MLKRSLLALVLLAQPLQAAELPAAIACYRDGANARDIDAYIDAYMACFAADAEMIDVSRTFAGHDAIRAWALREAIPHGDTFRHRRILETSEGFAKTEVKWLSWAVHYSYRWDKSGKIVRMSLQYAD